MKFYDNDNDLERAKEKYRVISDVVKEMRRIDPTRPICFDSNYQAKGKDEKFGTDFMNSIDDGDIDDMDTIIGMIFLYSVSLTVSFRRDIRCRIVRSLAKKCQQGIQITRQDILHVLIN